MPVEEKDKTPGPNPAENNPAAKEDKPNIIQQIEELKKNSVSKEDYDKVVMERDDAYKALLDGQKPEVHIETKEDKDKRIKTLREELYGKKIETSNMKNLDYWEKTLELRNALMENGEEDPFLGGFIKEGTVLEDADYDKAQKCADVLQGIVDDARKAEKEHGDNPYKVFNALYDSRIAEGTVPKGKGGRR